MTALVRTPVLPEATSVGALSAQLRRQGTRSPTSALRRLEPSASRKQPPFIDGGANRSIRPSVLQDRRDERVLRARRPTSAGGDMRVIGWPATPNSQRNPHLSGGCPRPTLCASALTQTDGAAEVPPSPHASGHKPRSSRGGNASVIVASESFECVCALAPPFSDPIGRDGAHLRLDYRGSDNLAAFEIAMR